MKKIRLGIIGFGAQGSTYAEFIKAGKIPQIEIGAICDIDTEKKSEVEKSTLMYHFIMIISLC